MSTQLWAPKWSQNNNLDGRLDHLMWSNRLPVIFRSRRECREWIDREYGYIRKRPDLQREPHCWRVPKPVKVELLEVGKRRRPKVSRPHQSPAPEK